MNHSSFKRPTYERRPLPAPRPVRAVAPTIIGTIALSQPKEAVIRSEPYRRLVAAMPCKYCGIQGYSQAAHPNTNKGSGIKTDDRECFALCTVHPGIDGLVNGCHERFDQGSLFAKVVRRELEPAWAADTRRQIIAEGKWPKGLPIPNDFASQQAWEQAATNKGAQD